MSPCRPVGRFSGPFSPSPAHSAAWRPGRFARKSFYCKCRRALEAWLAEGTEGNVGGVDSGLGVWRRLVGDDHGPDLSRISLRHPDAVSSTCCRWLDEKLSGNAC